MPTRRTAGASPVVVVGLGGPMSRFFQGTSELKDMKDPFFVTQMRQIFDPHVVNQHPQKD